MGYWTYFNGNCEFELNEPYYSILKSKVELNLNSSDFIKENYFFVEDEWKNRGNFIEDLLLFIEKYGTIKDCSIVCRGESDYDLHEILLYEGKVYKMFYNFKEEKEEEIKNGWEEVYQKIQKEEGIRKSNFFTLGKIKLKEVEKIEVILENLQYGRMVKKEEIEFLHKKVENKELELNIYLEEEKIFWGQGKITKIPFLPDEELVRVEVADYYGYESLISKYEIDPYEKRIMNVCGRKIPIHEAFMKYFSPSTNYLIDHELVDILMPNGEKKSICSQCTKRLEMTTGKCVPCQPEIVPYKD